LRPTSPATTLNVNVAVAATQAVGSKTLTAGTAATRFTPVTGAGGVTPLAYAVSPALPAGLTLDTLNGSIAGMASAASAVRAYTVTVTDPNGSMDSKTFLLTVTDAVSATQAVASTTLTAGAAATSFAPVMGSGGLAPLAYSISPNLPSGLTQRRPAP
jgi:hypothetical protein